MATQAPLPAHAIALDHHDRPSGVAGEEPPAPEDSSRANDGGAGLLFAFLATTMVMVGAIAALAVLGAWWWLIPVVLVHWVTTYVILARLGALIDQV